MIPNSALSYSPINAVSSSETGDEREVNSSPNARQNQELASQGDLPVDITSLAHVVGTRVPQIQAFNLFRPRLRRLQLSAARAQTGLCPKAWL